MIDLYVKICGGYNMKIINGLVVIFLISGFLMIPSSVFALDNNPQGSESLKSVSSEDVLQVQVKGSSGGSKGSSSSSSSKKIKVDDDDDDVSGDDGGSWWIFLIIGGIIVIAIIAIWFFFLRK